MLFRWKDIAAHHLNNISAAETITGKVVHFAPLFSHVIHELLPSFGVTHNLSSIRQKIENYVIYDKFLFLQAFQENN